MDCLPLDRPRCFKLQYGVEHAHPDPFALLVTGRPKFERALNGMVLGGWAVLINEQLGGAIRVERVHTKACDGKGRSCKAKGRGTPQEQVFPRLGRSPAALAAASVM